MSTTKSKAKYGVSAPVNRKTKPSQRAAKLQKAAKPDPVKSPAPSATGSAIIQATKAVEAPALQIVELQSDKREFYEAIQKAGSAFIAVELGGKVWKITDCPVNPHILRVLSDDYGRTD